MGKGFGNGHAGKMADPGAYRGCDKVSRLLEECLGFEQGLQAYGASRRRVWPQGGQGHVRACDCLYLERKHIFLKLISIDAGTLGSS